MLISPIQLHRRFGFQVAGDPLDQSNVSADHQVRMIVSDAAGPNVVSTFGYGLPESGSDKFPLTSIESDGWIREGSLGFETNFPIMWVTSQVPALIRLRSRPKLVKLLRSDKLRP